MPINSSWINLTDNCNISCEWCYVKGSTSNKVMETTKAFQILDWLQEINCGKCVLIGGEPTIHPKLPSIIKYGEDRGIPMHLVSNGRRFANENFCDQVISSGLSINRLTFSMYACSPESSKKLTGSAIYFREFETGFKNMSKKGIIPNITITVSRPILEYAEAMIRWSRDAGVKNIILNMGVPTVSQNKIDGSFTLSPNKLGEESVRLYKLAVDCNLNVKVFLRVPFCVLSKDDIMLLQADNAIQVGCHVQAGSGIVFTVKGEITTCNHLLDFPVYSEHVTREIGVTGQLSYVWENTPLISISESARAFRSANCQNCKYYGICTGGCPIVWSFYDPQEYITGWVPK